MQSRSLYECEAVLGAALAHACHSRGHRPCPRCCPSPPPLRPPLRACSLCACCTPCRNCLDLHPISNQRSVRTHAVRDSQYDCASWAALGLRLTYCCTPNMISASTSRAGNAISASVSLSTCTRTAYYYRYDDRREVFVVGRHHTHVVCNGVHRRSYAKCFVTGIFLT